MQQQEQQQQEQQQEDQGSILGALTVKALKSICKARHIEGYSRLNKLELINLILSNNTASQPQPAAQHQQQQLVPRSVVQRRQVQASRQRQATATEDLVNTLAAQMQQLRRSCPAIWPPLHVC